MTYRGKRTRLSRLALAKDTTTESVQNVVAQVIHDVANIEGEDADATHSTFLNQSTDRSATTQSNHVTTTETDNFGSSGRNTFGRQSFSPPPNQPRVTDPQQPKASQNWSLHGQSTGVQSNHDVGSGGADGQETELGSKGNLWRDFPPMTEAKQGTAVEANDYRPNKRKTDGRRSLTPPPSRSGNPGSPRQLMHSQKLSEWVQVNDGEPSLHGLSRAQHSKTSRWGNDVEFDEMDVVENDEERTHHRVSRSQNSKASKWSGDIEIDEMEEVEMRDSKGKRGKKRGPILPRHVWSLRPGVRFVVPFNSLDQPVRKGGLVLIRFLGDIAKNADLCPIGEVNWPRVDERYKANIISLVREKFILPDRPGVDKCILKHVGNRWKNHRHDLKTQYKKPGKTLEQVASAVPRGINPSDWVKLVQYWFSEKSKLFSEKGKAARAAQTHVHTSGAKSFARKRDEFEKIHGRDPGALEWFVETHQKKDGTFVENTSKEFVDAAAAMIAQRGSTSSRHKTVETEIFNELMYSDDEKRYQRPIGYGFGVNGNKVFGVGSEVKKREYWPSSTSADAGSSKKKLFRVGAERRKSGYLGPDSSAEVERLNFAMTAMGETNELMQAQIKMQSQQLQMQSQQLQMQSKQIDSLQLQLQQVTSMLTKFGAMLNNPQINHMSRDDLFQGVNGMNRRVPEASSEYSDGETDSSEWESD